MGNAHYTIGSHSVTVTKQIAEGGFSFVYLARSNSRPHRHFAVKKIHTQSAEQLELARHEVRAHAAVQHEAVLRLLDHAEVRRSEEVVDVLLLFPYYGDGSLFDLVRERKAGWPWAEDQCLLFFLACCEAVNAVHSAGFTHRDIKPHNILLSQQPVPRSTPPSSLSCRLAAASLPRPVFIDLGSLTASPFVISSRAAALEHQDTAAIHTSIAYRPPELMLVPFPATLDGRCDVWMLGCTLYFLSQGEEAERGRTRWDDEQQTEPRLRQRSRPYREYVDGLLRLKMEERCTLQEAMDRGRKLLELGEAGRRAMERAAEQEEKSGADREEEWGSFTAADTAAVKSERVRSSSSVSKKKKKEPSAAQAKVTPAADERSLDKVTSSLAAALFAGEDEEVKASSQEERSTDESDGQGGGASTKAVRSAAAAAGDAQVDSVADDDEFGDFASAALNPSSQQQDEGRGGVEVSEHATSQQAV